MAKMFWSSEGLSLRFNVGTIQTEGNLQETMKHSFWTTKKTHNGVFRLFSHPVSVACLLTSTNSRTVGDGVLRLLRIILGMESDLSDGHSKYSISKSFKRYVFLDLKDLKEQLKYMSKYVKIYMLNIYIKIN